MKETARNTDFVRFQRAADLDDLEFLHATFVKHSFPRHTHDTFAIGVIEKGTQATYYKGSTHIATCRDICLVNPGEVHTGFSPTATGWTYRVFYPDSGLLARIAAHILPHARELPHFSSPVIRDAPLALDILSFLRTLECSDLSLERQSRLLSLLAHMISRHADRKAGAPARQGAPGAVKTSLEYLDSRFTENVTLYELSRAAGLSEFHLLRLFRAAVGLPPHAYLIQKRIDHARRLLSEGLPITEVSLETGFADQSHFTRAFTRIVGVTPGRYRRNSNSVQDKAPRLRLK
ncbi:MAG: AraC family transcriptional regulator [Syntrophorhabdaceae bacterium]|nr:AraC family transcriptional regulator [Syntrophorhabdaceae bacterium]